MVRILSARVLHGPKAFSRPEQHDPRSDVLLAIDEYGNTHLPLSYLPMSAPNIPMFYQCKLLMAIKAKKRLLVPIGDTLPIRFGQRSS